MPDAPSVETIDQLTRDALDELNSIGESAEVEQWRVGYLGRRGKLTGLLRSLSDLEPDLRREVGSRANQAKNTLEEALARRTREIAQAALAAQDALDVTLPGRPVVTGAFAPDDADRARDLRRVHGHGVQRG